MFSRQKLILPLIMAVSTLSRLHFSEDNKTGQNQGITFKERNRYSTVQVAAWKLESESNQESSFRPDLVYGATVICLPQREREKRGGGGGGEVTHINKATVVSWATVTMVAGHINMFSRRTTMISGRYTSKLKTG